MAKGDIRDIFNVGKDRKKETEISTIQTTKSGLKDGVGRIPELARLAGLVGIRGGNVLGC